MAMHRAAAMGQETPVGGLAGLDLGRLQDVRIPVVEKGGDGAGGVGGKPLDALPGAVVEGLDGVAGGHVARLADGRQHRVGHCSGLAGHGVAEALGHGPGHEGEQQKG